MKNNKVNKPALILLACACVFGLFYVSSVVKNCSGSRDTAEDRWNKVVADDSYVTGETAEGTKSVNEGETYVPERPSQVSDAAAEAPSEGLSQIVYENLEQPAPIDKQPEVILMKSAFIVSYNLNTLCPNYVAWKLDNARTRGNAQRTNEYIPDPALSEGSQVQSSDFAGSGYDRGHMCPAGDNKNDQRAMEETFMLTNICPQSHDLNGGWWNDLEMLCRQWAKDKGDLYIVAGPIFDSSSPKKIGKRRNMKISVPDRFFKVILMGGDAPKAIGFIVPNMDVHESLSNYAVSIDKVEQVTGIDFYPNLPDAVERRVERECKPEAWGL